MRFIEVSVTMDELHSIEPIRAFLADMGMSVCIERNRVITAYRENITNREILDIVNRLPIYGGYIDCDVTISL
jgi:hypothetical protein